MSAEWKLTMLNIEDVKSATCENIIEKVRNEIIVGDCLEVMKKLPDKCVDLVLTSPPYDTLRDYKGYSFDFEKTAQELARVTKDGGVIVWVVGDQVKDGSETCTSFKQAIYFKEMCGLRLHDTMIYQKKAMPFPDKTRYIQCFEYMFILSKGKPKTHNLLQEKTKGYKPSTTNTQRMKDGTKRLLKYQQGKEYRNRWNVWVYDVGYMKSAKEKYIFEHPAIFPEKLANEHIHTWSNEGDIVLDPMAGSGTTLSEAQKLNRKFIGIEISPEYCKIAEERLKNLQPTLI